MARALRAWAINRWGKNSVRNLQYGPRTRLVRGISISPNSSKMDQMSKTIHSLLFCRIFIRWLNARIESRENWTSASCSLRSHTPHLSPACFALASLAYSTPHPRVPRTCFARIPHTSAPRDSHSLRTHTPHLTPACLALASLAYSTLHPRVPRTCFARIPHTSAPRASHSPRSHTPHLTPACLALASLAYPTPQPRLPRTFFARIPHTSPPRASHSLRSHTPHLTPACLALASLAYPTPHPRVLRTRLARPSLFLSSA